jgi:hypothetical protein
VAAKSTYLNNAAISAALRNVALQVAAQFISLHTADPGLTGASEVAGNAYARVATPGFIAPTLGVSTNGNVVTFPAPTPANWGTVTYAGVWDALTVGNFLYKIPLTFSVATSVGVPVEFEIAALSITET